MNPSEVISYLTKTTRSEEAYHVSTFKLFRTSKDEHDQKVNVQIFDAGEEVNKHLRYYCVAESDDGRTALGNTAESIGEALSIVHWGDLDRDR